MSICVVLLSYWANVQSLNVLLGMYDNIETDFMFEVMTLDFNRIVNLSAQLQVVDFVFIFFRNIILQFFLSLVFDFLQDFTTNNPVHKVSGELSYMLFQINIIFYRCLFYFFLDFQIKFYNSYLDCISTWYSWIFEYHSFISNPVAIVC